MFRFLFQEAFLCVVSPLCRHTTCPTTTAAPPTRILSRYLRKVLQGTECEGLGVVGQRGVEGRSSDGMVVGGGKKGERGRERGRKRLSGPFIKGSDPLLPPPSILHLVLPIAEPWGPSEAAPCLAAIQPLYHSNLLIVGAELAHGGFLLEPPNIN